MQRPRRNALLLILLASLCLACPIARADAGILIVHVQALAIQEKALGPDHPDVAIDLNNLAGLLYAEGDYAGAEPLYRRALAIDEKALGPNHPKTLQIKKNLDGLLQKSAQAAAPKAKN